MKKLIVLYSLLLSSFLVAQTNWKFPVKMGTPEWKELKTIEEVRDIQQIPLF